MKQEWKPAASKEEAIRIVKEHPITAEMTYKERLEALKARFGL